jgi:uncharacterized protein YjbI with pentapeptide repeats
VETDNGQPTPGERIEDADFEGAHLHGPNFEGAKITDGWFLNADISGDLEGLRLNGVEVAPLVEAELDRQFPERVKLRVTDPAGLAEAWAMVEDMWATTIARARELPEPKLLERVDHEWSFVETQRHLIMATDCWLRRMVLGIAHSYHPWGLAGFPIDDAGNLGIDPAAEPSFDQVLEVRRGHLDQVRQTIADLTADELERVCQPPQTPGHPNRPCTVLECLHVVLNEEWEHHRYAVRDLTILESRDDRS